MSIKTSPPSLRSKGGLFNKNMLTFQEKYARIELSNKKECRWLQHLHSSG